MLHLWYIFGAAEDAGLDGPAAVWMVLTTCEWAQQHRHSMPRHVAGIVSERAMHVLCRAEDEAATQRIMRANMPLKTSATLWDDALLLSLPGPDCSLPLSIQLACSLSPPLRLGRV